MFRLLPRKLLLPLGLSISLLTPALAQAGILEWLGLKEKASTSQQDFLPVEQAFVLSSKQSADQVTLTFSIAPESYLYRHKLSVTGLQSQLGEWQLPQGEPHEDVYFGSSQVFYQQLTFTIPLQHVADDGQLQVQYQGCTTGLCYPPQTVNIALNSLH